MKILWNKTNHIQTPPFIVGLMLSCFPNLYFEYDDHLLMLEKTQKGSMSERIYFHHVESEIPIFIVYSIIIYHISVM